MQQLMLKSVIKLVCKSLRHVLMEEIQKVYHWKRHLHSLWSKIPSWPLILSFSSWLPNVSSSAQQNDCNDYCHGYPNFPRLGNNHNNIQHNHHWFPSFMGSPNLGGLKLHSMFPPPPPAALLVEGVSFFGNLSMGKLVMAASSGCSTRKAHLFLAWIHPFVLMSKSNCMCKKSFSGVSIKLQAWCKLFTKTMSLHCKNTSLKVTGIPRSQCPKTLPSGTPFVSHWKCPCLMEQPCFDLSHDQGKAMGCKARPHN